MSIVTTFEGQCRALTSTSSPDENASRFLVGTLSPNKVDNLLYLFEYKDDNNNLAKVSFRFPYGESWHLSSSSKYPRLLAGVLGDRGKLSVSLFKLPDELEQTIEDDYGLSESTIEQLYSPIKESTNLVRQSHWHPEDGCQLLTCNNGSMQFWDINEQKQVKTFSLLLPAEKALNLETDRTGDTTSLKPLHISDLRWSSLFNCSVVAAAIGPRIYGVDTRIPDSSPASICWLIEDQRCIRIRTIDFNSNSQYYIASGGDDCRCNIWDLRQTSSPALYMQTHTHWIWSVRYNPFHDQLILSAGSDARVTLMRAQSVASEPYGQIAVDEDDDDKIDDEEEDGKQEEDDDNKDNSESSEISEKSQRTKKGKSLADEVINIYEEHDDSVYATEWATDPWIFASLGFESRLVINKVPKSEKFNILF